MLGGIAFCAAVIHFFAGPIVPPPTLEETTAEIAVNLKDAVKAKLTGEEYTPERPRRSRDADDWLRIGTVCAGVVAIVLGLLAFIRREDLRVSGSAAVLGGAAVAFQFFALALGVIALVILIGAVLSNLGL
jgi:hypothetical protein